MRLKEFIVFFIFMILFLPNEIWGFINLFSYFVLLSQNLKKMLINNLKIYVISTLMFVFFNIINIFVLENSVLTIIL